MSSHSASGRWTGDARQHLITAHPKWQCVLDRADPGAVPVKVSTAGLARIQSACYPNGGKVGLTDERF